MAMNNAYNPSSEGLMGTPVAQDIDQLADTYANKPEYLNQQYKVTQELKYLLAAQKVAGLLAEADKQLTASMAQQPSTVAQDMEQELLGRVQKMAGDGQDPRSKAQQVGGVLANKQQQQQQNMQRAAQGPQQGSPPMMAAGGLLSQRAPNLERMYGGGIVSFVGGGDVTEEEIEEYIRLNPTVSREEAFEYLRKRELGSPARETVETFRDEKLRAFKDAMTARRAQDEPVVEKVVDETAIDIAPATPRAPKTGTFPALEQKQQGQGLSGLPGANLAPALLGAMGVQNAEQKPELEAAGVVDTPKSAEMLDAAKETLKKVGGANVDTAFGRGSERAKQGLASIKDPQRQKDLYEEQEGIAKEYSRRNRSEGEKSFERFLAGAAGGSGRAWTTGAGMKAGMDAQEASDYARDKDLLGTLKGITDTDLARQLDIEKTVLASGESLEGSEMERQSKALAAEVSLYQTLNAEERAIYKAENDQKIAKYNSEVQQIADAQRNAIASKANELALAFNTEKLKTMSADNKNKLKLNIAKFVAEQRAAFQQTLIELKTDPTNLLGLKDLAKREDSTVADELKAQEVAMTAAFAASLAEITGLSAQLESSGDDWVGWENVTGSS
jgi:hypothetical protein